MANPTKRKDVTIKPISSQDAPKVRARTVREINKSAEKRRKRTDAASRLERTSHTPFIVGGAILAVVILALIAMFALSRTNVFEIKEVSIQGADHLTSQEANALVSIPQGTTLLNVDSDSVIESLKRDSWVEDVRVERTFPDKLEVIITEREVGAVVEVPMGQSQTIQNWAISTDRMWLMPIPARDSTIGSQLSPLIFEEADSVLHITGVPYGVDPKIGYYCTDDNIINALSIISGLTTELVDEVKSVSATDPESTMLILKSNIEISFGNSDNVREKERVCLQIMQDIPNVVYINVRIVDRPTWKEA